MIFLSLIGLVQLLKAGRVSANDLSTALFYLGCNCQELLGSGKAGKNAVRHVVGTDEEEVERIFGVIREATQLARSHGRASFSRRSGDVSYIQLNELLCRNGYCPILTSGTFSWNEAIRRIQAENPELVVWYRLS